MSYGGLQFGRDRENATNRAGKAYEDYLALTDRELEILEVTATGLTSEETAKELFIAFQTVKTYKKRIILKLDAKNMVHAVAKAIRQGLI